MLDATPGHSAEMQIDRALLRKFLCHHACGRWVVASVIARQLHSSRTKISKNRHSIHFTENRFFVEPAGSPRCEDPHSVAIPLVQSIILSHRV